MLHAAELDRQGEVRRDYGAAKAGLFCVAGYNVINRCYGLVRLFQSASTIILPPWETPKRRGALTSTITSTSSPGPTGSTLPYR